MTNVHRFTLLGIAMISCSITTFAMDPSRNWIEVSRGIQVIGEDNVRVKCHGGIVTLNGDNCTIEQQGGILTVNGDNCTIKHYKGILTVNGDHCEIESYDEKLCVNGRHCNVSQQKSEPDRHAQTTPRGITVGGNQRVVQYASGDGSVTQVFGGMPAGAHVSQIVRQSLGNMFVQQSFSGDGSSIRQVVGDLRGIDPSCNVSIKQVGIQVKGHKHKPQLSEEQQFMLAQRLSHAEAQARQAAAPRPETGRKVFMNQECPVCLEDFGGSAMRLACGHLLCKVCLPKVDNCPLCRQKG